jgi:hypothetical protein
MDRIRVAFEGEGSGVDELSWGQLDIWTAMVRLNTWLPIGGVNPLPAGTTVDDVAEDLRYLMSRYQSMRTRLRFDTAGRPTQVVSASGEIALEMVDAGDDDPAAVAEAVCQRYRETDYDFVDEWPVRMAAVRRHGVLTHLALVMCHLVTDGFGALVMMAELADRRTGAVRGMQALEQVRWQRSPAGVRQNEAALRYWEGLLRTIPLRRFGESTQRRRPRHWSGEFRSPAMLAAVRAIAARTGGESAPVLLTVFAVALARMTGINPVAIRPVVNNRFRPGLAEVVCPVSQAGLFALDVADVCFDEALARTRRATMAAHKYAYYNRTDLEALIERIVAQRGPQFDVGCFFNDRRLTSGADNTGPPLDAVRSRDALPRSTFQRLTAFDGPNEPLFVNVEPASDCVHLTVFADTHFVSYEDGETLLRGMEHVAVEAALDPTARAEGQPP